MRSFRWVGSIVAAGLVSGAALAAHAQVSTGPKTVALAVPGAAKPAVAARPGDDNVPFAADPADPLDMDAIFDGPDLSSIDLTTIDRATWTPEHAASAPATGSAKQDVTRQEAAKQDVAKQDKNDDPEPDGIITPPPAQPSNDPLDRPKPTLDKPAAGKPGDAAPQGAPTAETKKEEPLPPLNAAIKAALDKRDTTPVKNTEQRKEREAVTFFYAAHGFAPAWSDAGKPIKAVEPVLTRLAKADEDALTIGTPPKDLKTTGTPEEIAASDLALTSAVVAYARQATGSRVDPRAISPLIGAKRDLADPAEVIDGLIAASDAAGDKLRALNPVDLRYAALRDKLAEMRGGHEPETVKIPAGSTLKVGMHDKRVPLLRSRFGLGPGADGETETYDEDVAAAVAEFQTAHGLTSTGNLNQRTQALLSGGKQSKDTGALIANMEMWRWMPRDMGADRIEVNVPDFLVRVYHDNTEVAQNRVVVGKTDTPTPIFSNTMKFLIVNPVWNVPQSIIENEMGDAPRAGFKARYVHGKLYLQQASGPKNALGRIKFMFPNDFSVYLHDTPSKSLFGASKRAFSHGCVRVDKPFSFAESVLNDGVPEGGEIRWSQKRLEKMLGDKERYVDLPKPLPIHIEYFTASVDPETGDVKTREDIYGYAYKVAAELGVATGRAPVVAERVVKPKRVADERPSVPRRRAARYASPDDVQPQQQQPQQQPGLFGGFWSWR